MGFDDGSIILNSENNAYYAGQTIFGRIVFDQGKPKTIHGIYVSCKGFCKVHWTSTKRERVNDRTVTKTINHDSYEEYFKRKHFVFGDNAGEHHLKAGQHEFNFDCPIPVNCPSSFEGSHGHIRYSIKVVMVTSGIFSSNKEKIIDVRVHAPLDLNQIPSCREPLECEIVSNYCCWCMSAGSSEIKVKLPVSGYCGGQVIPMEVSVANPSSVEIDELKFSIKKEVKFEATSSPGTKYDKDVICKIKKGPIAAGATRNWTLEMEVPAMDIYNLNACRFIDITYYFEVKSSLASCHEDGEDTQLITFGTVPLVGFQDNIQNPLHDQLPRPLPAPTTSYPPPPIINQPMPSPFLNGHTPQNTPYPTSYPTSPVITPPYPNPVQPNISPYPNSPYPGNPGSPYPPGPFQSSPVPPYPGHSPSPAPYPVTSPTAYPGVTPSSAFPGSIPTTGYQASPGLKTGQIGFVGGDPAQVPLLPPGTMPPYPTVVTSPYATASAPEPSTPGDDTTSVEINSSSPAYNPEFMKTEKKDDVPT